MYPECRSDDFYRRVRLEFLVPAKEDRERKGNPLICCLCARCRNETLYSMKSGFLLQHLFQFGFMEGYTRRTSHDEEAIVGDDEGMKMVYTRRR